jgi:hypothetical protein
MDLREQIKNAIDKDLPKQVGDSLKRRLEEADQTEKELKRVTAALETKELTIVDLNKTIKDLTMRVSSEQELLARERQVNDRENKLEITLLQGQLESEKEKSKFGFDVSLGLVRNTQFRRNLTDTHTLPSIMSPQGYPVPQNTFQNSTETKEEL